MYMCKEPISPNNAHLTRPLDVQGEHYLEVQGAGEEASKVRASEQYTIMSNSKEQGESNPAEVTPELLVKKHIQFFKRVMNVVPPSAIAMDTNRSVHTEILLKRSVLRGCAE